MISPPRIHGLALRSLARVARSSAGATLLKSILRAELHVDELVKRPEAERGGIPLHTRALQARPPRAREDAELPLPPAPWSGSSETWRTRFESRVLSPVEATQRCLEIARGADRSLKGLPIFAFDEAGCLAAARASEERFRQGTKASALDGVPTAIKEELAVRGFPHQFGSQGLPDTRSEEDAYCVASLRAAGPSIIGITPMTELGMTPTGANPFRPMPRNPHDVNRIAGGSSTGSAVAVASGLVPFAVGADGGGSIRIPASLCGIFGIKPTWGRISRHLGPGGSVAHLGPLASSTLDLARALEHLSGIDARDTETLAAPPRDAHAFERAIRRGVRGMRIGVLAGEWRDASEPVARAGQNALDALAREGAELVEIDIPLAPHAPAIGYVVIGVESRALFDSLLQSGARITDDLAVSFAATGEVSAFEYVTAQRLREGLRIQVASALEQVDVLALPSTVSVAPRASDAEMASSFLDAKAIGGLCRFAFLANLTGLPALSAPVGTDSEDMPVGLQLVGDAWDEATVLAISAHLERIGVATARRPPASFDLLQR